MDANAKEECIPCQIIISAIGQDIESTIFEKWGVPLEKGHTLSVNSSGQVTNMDGVFAGGDCVTGPSTVINAIAAGKVAAANIDNTSDTTTKYRWIYPFRSLVSPTRNLAAGRNCVCATQESGAGISSPSSRA